MSSSPEWCGKHTFDETTPIVLANSDAADLESPYIEGITLDQEQGGVEYRDLAEVGDLQGLVDFKASDNLLVVELVQAPALSSYQELRLLLYYLLQAQGLHGAASADRLGGVAEHVREERDGWVHPKCTFV